MNRAGIPLHRTGLGRWPQERYPSPRPVEVIFLQAAKRLRGQTAAKPWNIEYEFILRQYTVNGETTTQVNESKARATLEEAEIDGAWLTAYAMIARRCRDDKDLGVSRYPHELVSGVSPFSGGYFEHREWAIRRGIKRHPSLRPLFEYEAHYTNSAGYWMSFSSAAMALRGEDLKLEGTTGVEEAEMFDVWATMAVRYGLRVVGLRVEIYKRSAKDPMHTRLVMPVLEGQNDTPATDDLDDGLTCTWPPN
jgi:hypothetical protein